MDIKDETDKEEPAATGMQMEENPMVVAKKKTEEEDNPRRESSGSAENPMAVAKKRMPVRNSDGSKTKTKFKICSFFKNKGRCSRGEFCAFAHGEKELHQPVLDEAILPGGPGIKTTLCKNHRPWEHLQCSWGKYCRFAHGQEEIGMHNREATNKGATKGTSKGPRRRSRSDSRDRAHQPSVLPIIIQTCSLVPLHQQDPISKIAMLHQHIGPGPGWAELIWAHLPASWMRWGITGFVGGGKRVMEWGGGGKQLQDLVGYYALLFW